MISAFPFLPIASSPDFPDLVSAPEFSSVPVLGNLVQGVR